MDQIFEAQETKRYEDWLETWSGQRYVAASRALLDRILDFRRGWRVLDVGCGLGVHLKHLQERGLLVHGLEAGPVMARLAAQRLGGKAEVDLGDAHDLPYEDNSFDAVLLVNTLELTDRRAQVLGEAARVAASRVCIITLNPVSMGGLWHRLRGGGHPLHRGGGLGLWTLWRLVREVLGPVPQTWAGASPLTGGQWGYWPVAGLVGLCAAVTPRYMTTPLLVETPNGKKQAVPTAPAVSRGRVTLLHRVK